MGKYRIKFSIREINNPVSENRLTEILNHLLSEQFGPFKRMALDLYSPSQEYIPYNKQQFILNLVKNDAHSYLLGEPGVIQLDSNLQADFKRSSGSNYTSLMIDRDDFIEIEGPKKIYDLFMSIVRLMPAVSNANISAIMSKIFYDQINMTRVLAPFGKYLDWIHILSPSEYLPKFTKEELLNAPAYRVEEWDNDVVFMMCYENPFEYELPENVERVRKISDYLRSKKRVIQIE
jgi:hypothetical protein